MKRHSKLIALVCVFVVLLAAFVGLRTLRSDFTGDRREEVQTVLTTLTGDKLSKLSFWWEKEQVTLLFENGAWCNASDPGMPLNQNLLNRMYDIVTTLTSVRTVTRYIDKADYGINSSSVRVMVEGIDGTGYGFTIGSYVSFSDGYYIMMDGDSNLYFVLGEIRKPFALHESDLVAMDPIPDMRHITSFSVSSSKGSFEAYLDGASNDWYALENSERIVLNAINTRATAGLLSRLVWRGCVDYEVAEADLAQYGLDVPATITATYTGTDEVSHGFTLCIGRPTGSSYYARLPGSQMVVLIQADLIAPLLNASAQHLRAQA
jgi:hypothetical protein